MPSASRDIAVRAKDIAVRMITADVVAVGCYGMLAEQPATKGGNQVARRGFHSP